MDFEGNRRVPSDKYAFLVALFDHLFWKGYTVTWKWVVPAGHLSGPFKN